MSTYKYSQVWFLESEIKQRLPHLLNTNAENKMLEIGCFEGLSSVFFADNFLDDANSRLTCVDPFLNIHNNDHRTFLQNDEELNFDFNISNCRNTNKITVHKITSDDFFANNTQTYNFIYIDGCHEPDFIIRDMENSFRFLETKGIMWMDDYGGGDGVQIKNAMNYFLTKYKDTLHAMSIAFLPLYGIDKSGRTKVWEASVSLNEDAVSATATISYGLINGKKQINNRIYTAGKNVGKSNETTPYQQAVYETQSKWTDKKDKEGYTTSTSSSATAATTNRVPEDNKESHTPSPPQQKILPMLAHTFDPNKPKNKIQFPCYVQPKLDGVRCICYLSEDRSRVLTQSRTGSYFESLDHLTTELLRPFLEIPELGSGGMALDGELYTNSMPFEQLVGLVKKKKLSAEDRDKLKEISYHVYDIVDIRPESTFQNRFQRLRDIHQQINNPYVKLVHTAIANNTEEFRAFFSVAVEDGFEGAMVRNITGRYLCNYRSHDLQKYKEFFENEYEICGYREAEGRDRGTVIWVCRLPNDPSAVFNVRPRGTLEMRRKWLEDGEKYVGKQITVIYQELSENGVPRFPVGKCLREGY